MLGSTCPAQGSCVSSAPVGAGLYSLKTSGRRWLGTLGFPNTDISNTCACDSGWGGLWTEEKLPARSILWEHYTEMSFFWGRLLYRNFVSMLALLGPWPETPLAGEILKDLGLLD